jgi:hypothetical protein
VRGERWRLAGSKERAAVTYQTVFLGGGFVLAAALLPTIAAGGGPQLSTSVLTATVLASYTWAFARQQQRWSALGVGLNAAAWVVLSLQAIA